MRFIIVQLLFIALTAVFTSVYTAMENINTTKLKSRIEDGDKKAKKLQKIADKPEIYASSLHTLANLLTVLGISVAVIIGEKGITSFFSERLSITVSPYVTCVLLVLVLLFFYISLGKFAPRRITLRRAEKLQEAYLGFALFFAAIVRPATWLMDRLSDFAVLLFGMDPKESDETVSEEDIVMMLDAGAEDGTINKDNIEYIKNVFELDHMMAADVMTPRNSIELLANDAADEEIISLIEESGYSRIPVFTDTVDNITGILIARDYLLNRATPDFKREDAIIQPTFVPETVHLDSLFKDMQTDHSHMVIVVDEYGGTAGLVTMEDILEEIVGEIWDEQDEEIENFVKTDEDTYKILSTTPIDEFFDFFKLETDEEIESTTVNGWVTEHSGNIPEVRFSFNYKNLSITVTKADDLRTQEICVHVEPIDEEATDGGKYD